MKINRLTEPRVFSCTDCGQDCVSFDGSSGDLCGVCAWVRTFVPPQYEAAVRERLGVPLIEVPP